MIENPETASKLGRVFLFKRNEKLCLYQVVLGYHALIVTTATLIFFSFFPFLIVNNFFYSIKKNLNRRHIWENTANISG